MRVLVTGSAGFVGAATVKLLEEAEGDPRDPIRSIGYDVMHGDDIRDLDRLRHVIDTFKPHRILHLAAIARFSEADAEPLRAMSVNVDGTATVVRAAEEAHIPLIYASTGSVYMPINKPPPITEDFPATGNSVYGVTKRLGELYVQGMQAPWMILRYAHLFGKEKRGHGLVGGFLDRINRGLAPTLYGGTQSNDFTYVKDVARANVIALNASWDAWNNVYNIGSGEELTTNEAGRLVCDAFNYDGEIQRFDQRPVDAQRFVYDTSKAERMLGFKAEYSFAEGLADMAADSTAVQPEYAAA